MITEYLRVSTLKQLALSFGLPYVERKEYIMIIGEKEILTFIKENSKCHKQL
jgi:hypothetical protein